jgi:hypothetical protein
MWVEIGGLPDGDPGFFSKKTRWYQHTAVSVPSGRRKTANIDILHSCTEGGRREYAAGEGQKLEKRESKTGERVAEL